MNTVNPATLSTSESAMWATFYLNNEMFALRVEDVQEVMMAQPLTPVPLAPQYIVGLLNLRGQIMPAIDLRRRLHFAARNDHQDSNLLVLKTRDGLVSVVVDQIGDVLELPRDDWRAPPETLAAQHRNFVAAVCPIENHVVLRLNVDALSDDDHSLTASISASSLSSTQE